MSQVRLSALNFIIRETPTQEFSGDYCKISKNNFFIELLQRFKSTRYQTTAVLMEPTPLQLGTAKYWFYPSKVEKTGF